MLTSIARQNLPMNCYQAKAGELAKHWYVIDAEGMVVGRLAAQIAPILMGKHRPTYTPHIDTGDYVIVTNVDKVVFTGNKWQQKIVSAVLRLPRRAEGRGRLEAVRASARADPRAGHPADDAQEQDRPAHDGQAQAVRRAEPPPPGPAADPAGAALGPAHARRRRLPVPEPTPKTKAATASPQRRRPRPRPPSRPRSRIRADPRGVRRRAARARAGSTRPSPEPGQS